MTVQNDLLQSRADEKADAVKETAKNNHNNFKQIKYIVFSAIWMFVAWNLLTVKEKNLIKRDILVHSNGTKGKIFYNKIKIEYSYRNTLIFRIYSSFKLSF